MPSMSTVGINYYPLKIGFFLYKNLDQGWVEFFGVQQIFNYFIKMSFFFQVIQFNNLKIHLIMFCF